MTRYPLADLFAYLTRRARSQSDLSLLALSPDSHVPMLPKPSWQAQVEARKMLHLLQGLDSKRPQDGHTQDGDAFTRAVALAGPYCSILSISAAVTRCVIRCGLRTLPHDRSSSTNLPKHVFLAGTTSLLPA